MKIFFIIFSFAIFFGISFISCKNYKSNVTHEIINQQSNNPFEKANEYFKKGDYTAARSYYTLVDSTNINYDEAQKKIIFCETEMKKNNKNNSDKKKSEQNEGNKNTIRKDYSENEKNSNWKQEFINYRETNNRDIEKLIIEESVLYIYVKNLTSDVYIYSKAYTIQFQKVYRINTGDNYVSSLVYLGGRLLKEYDADNNGIK